MAGAVEWSSVVHRPARARCGDREAEREGLYRSHREPGLSRVVRLLIARDDRQVATERRCRRGRWLGRSRWWHRNRLADRWTQEGSRYTHDRCHRLREERADLEW